MKSVWIVTQVMAGFHGKPMIAAPTRKQAKAFVDAEFPNPNAEWTEPNEVGDISRYAYMAVQGYRVSKVKIL